MYNDRDRQSMESQLELIEQVDDYMHDGDGRRQTYMIAGGWAVDGIVGNITRPHENVDVMVPQDNSEALTSVLKDNHMKIYRKGENLRAENGKVAADVIVLCPEGEDYIFETPYHNPGKPIQQTVPQKHMKIKRVRLTYTSCDEDGKRMHYDIKFAALNPTALYFAKIPALNLPKEHFERDLKDIKKLAPFVSETKREQARFYANF